MNLIDQLRQFAILCRMNPAEARAYLKKVKNKTELIEKMDIAVMINFPDLDSIWKEVKAGVE